MMGLPLHSLDYDAYEDLFILTHTQTFIQFDIHSDVNSIHSYRRIKSFINLRRTQTFTHEQNN